MTAPVAAILALVLGFHVVPLGQAGGNTVNYVVDSGGSGYQVMNGMCSGRSMVRARLTSAPPGGAGRQKLQYVVGADGGGYQVYGDRVQPAVDGGEHRARARVVRAGRGAVVLREPRHHDVSRLRGVQRLGIVVVRRFIRPGGSRGRPLLRRLGASQVLLPPLLAVHTPAQG